MSALKDWLKKLSEPAVLVPAVIGIFITGGGGVFIGHHFWTNNSVNPAVKITCPQSGAIRNSINISGTADLPEGDSIWIVVQTYAPVQYFLLGQARITSTTIFGTVSWSSPGATIGAASDPAGTQYQIYALILDAGIGNYLEALVVDNNSETETFNASSNGNAPMLPPDILANDYVGVTRGSEPETC